jgi:superfamily II DNA/RNA helicase
MSFENLGLHEALLRAVKDSGYETATEVQSQAIPRRCRART